MVRTSQTKMIQAPKNTGTASDTTDANAFENPRGRQRFFHRQPSDEPAGDKETASLPMPCRPSSIDKQKQHAGEAGAKVEAPPAAGARQSEMMAQPDGAEKEARRQSSRPASP